MKPLDAIAVLALLDRAVMRLRAEAAAGRADLRRVARRKRPSVPVKAMWKDGKRIV